MRFYYVGVMCDVLMYNDLSFSATYVEIGRRGKSVNWLGLNLAKQEPGMGHNWCWGFACSSGEYCMCYRYSIRTGCVMDISVFTHLEC